MHITIEEMNKLDFQSYRKSPSFRIWAKRLTKEDYDRRGGIVNTMEGPVAFQPGDYLLRGIPGEEYPSTPQSFASFYDAQSMESDLDGFARYCPRNLIHQAVQIAEPFAVESGAGGFYTGKAGDYLVRTEKLSSGRIVDRTIFEQIYERVVDT
jgi:hypothetical protein